MIYPVKMRLHLHTITKNLAIGAFLVFFVLVMLVFDQEPCGKPAAIMVPREETKFIHGHENERYSYNRTMPLVFIGGVPRSGTTLMRVMLDAHPDVRCGEETRVIPRLLGMRHQWYKSPKEVWRLREAGLNPSVINDAISAFILEIIAKHGQGAPRLCNKDPFMLKSAVYLSQMFPNAKFLMMIRDGRATVHSIITRKVTITGFNLDSYRQCLERWNMAVEAMYNQCLQVGRTRCLPVFYEQLVLHPEREMRRVLSFLDLPWNSTVLHHDELIGKHISLSKTERSSDQVIKPINLDALRKWVGHLPQDVLRDMGSIAPMLRVFKYDPYANPPNYGQPDVFVLEKTSAIQRNRNQWAEKEASYTRHQMMLRLQSSQQGRRWNSASSDGLR